jgi:hypothetical protein
MKTMFRLLGTFLNALAGLSPSLAGQLGFQLFCYPVRRKISAKQRQFLTSAKSFELAVEGERLVGYRWGWGPTQILLLHGWGSDSYFWRSLVESLSPHDYSIAAFDAPGHGLSTGSEFHFPRYRECIRACFAQQGPFHAIVGHSFGAAAAYFTLTTTPSLQVQGLCMVATPSRLADFLTQWSALLGLNERVQQQIVAQGKRKLGISIPEFSFDAFAPLSNTAGLILHDPADPESPYAGAEGLATRWGDASLVKMPGEGHNMRSARVNTQIRGFLALNAPSGIEHDKPEHLLTPDDLFATTAVNA